jgi:hypothetical protein
MTKNFSRGLVVAFAFFVAALPAHAANIVINPGFETGDFTGWTEGGHLDHTFVDTVPNAPHSGSFAAQLGAVGGDNTLSQILSTVAGTTYDLSYWHIYAPDAGPVGDFSVQWNSTTIHSEVSVDPPTPQTWTLYNFLVTGTGSDTLQFTSRDVRWTPMVRQPEPCFKV